MYKKRGAIAPLFFSHFCPELTGAPCQNRTYKFRLALAVGIHIISELLCQLLLELLIVLPCLRVGPQIIPKCQVFPIRDRVREADIEVIFHRVPLPVIVVLRAEECLSSRKPQISLMLIAAGFQSSTNCPKIIGGAKNRIHIDDRLCTKPFHRGGANVLDCLEIRSNRVVEHLSDSRKGILPRRVIGYDDDLTGRKLLLLVLCRLLTLQRRLPPSESLRSSPDNRGPDQDKV